jgi:maltose O-acetyltransferase
MPRKSEKQKMLDGDPYRADDAELLADYAAAQGVLAEFNAIRADDLPALARSLARLLGSFGAGAMIKPPFRCDYGRHIRVGARSFANYGCVFLDCAAIDIGAEVQIGPGVHLYTATHPLEAASRRSGLESARPVRIGDGVWLGGRSVVCPGVSIGANTVVGAGSVVVRDLPEGVLAAGNPARVIRRL